MSRPIPPPRGRAPSFAALIAAVVLMLIGAAATAATAAAGEAGKAAAATAGVTAAATRQSPVPHSTVRERRAIEPVDLRRGPHRLADGYLIAESHGVERVAQDAAGAIDSPHDRTVAQQTSGKRPGTLLTVPLHVRDAGTGSALLLDADASDGQIRVQARNLNGEIIPGFSFEDCQPITGEGAALPVQWLTIVDGEMQPGLIDLVRLDDQTIRLEFEITNAKLFGFDLRPGDARPLRLGQGPHLFIDDYLIAVERNLRRTTRTPERLEQPILGIKHDPNGHLAPGTLLYDADRDLFRLWYWTRNEDGSKQMWHAESRDPKNWPIQGEAVLRIVGDIGKLIVDDQRADDPQRRYKLATFLDKPLQGAGVWFSPDGKQWTAYDGNPVLPYYPFGHPNWRRSASDILDPYWDPIRCRYGMFVKLWSDGEEEFGVNSRTAPPGIPMGIRLTGMATSADFVHWSQPWRIFEPDHRDSAALEHYGGHVMPRGDLLIAFMRILRDDLGEEGTGYTVLASSRDGQTWTRHRDPLLEPTRTRGAFDNAFAWVQTAATKDDAVYLVYSGYDQGHKTGRRQIGLAWLPRDRFVARESQAGKEAILRTPLIACTGGPPGGLWLNADASHGSIRVRVLDAQGRPVEGLEESRPLNGDGLALPVEWSEHLASVAQRPFRLEFTLRDAALYGFSFAHEPPRSAAATQ